MKSRFGPLALALAVTLVTSAPAAETKRPTRDLASFGVLQAPSLEEAKTQAQNWLKSAGKTDEASQKAFDAIWSADRALLDKVADTLSLGDANAAKLLADARDPRTPAPTSTPALLKDLKVNPFLRANLALAYAKSLAGRRVYEEVLEALKIV